MIDSNTTSRTTNRTINYAHRGYRAKYPENTMLAFKKAIEAGCGGIELDIQLTKDGELVIIHDEDVRRTTNGTGVVCEMTYERLRGLDAGGGERIPLLSEYFGLVRELPLVTNIELKNSEVPYDGMEEKALEMVRSYGLSEQVIFSSFNHDSVRKMKKLAPDIKCGFICCGKLSITDVAAMLSESGAEFVHPDIAGADAAFMEAAASRGIRVSIWTVNDRRKMRELIDQGAYGIFTDDPATLAEVLSLTEFPN